MLPFVILLLLLSAPANAATSKPASEFLESIGVGVHMGKANTAYTNTSAVASAIDYLGVKYARDDFTTVSGSDRSYTAMQSLYNINGTKFAVIMTPNGDNYSVKLAAMLAAPQLVAEVEGPNEVDYWTISWAGYTGAAAALAFQQQLGWDIPPAGLTLNTYALRLSTAIASHTPTVGDRSNSHCYTQWGGGNIWNSLKWCVDTFKAVLPGAPHVMTETGVWTTPCNKGVNETVQAEYTLNALVSNFFQGVKRTYLYELSDEVTEVGCSTQEKHFGLFKADWTPKASATALHNLTTILADSGTNTGSLGYSLTGAPSTLRTLLFKKNYDGAYWVLLWNNIPRWDLTNNTEITVGTQQVLLNFGITCSEVKKFDPMVGTSQIGATQYNIGGLTVDVPTYPILYKCLP